MAGPQDAGSIRVGVLVHVPEVLRTFGLDPAGVVERAGLDLALLQDADNVIPYVALDRLVGICARETCCPHFGLLLGQLGGPASLGPLGLLIQHAPDVDTALRELVLYLHIHDGGAAPNLEIFRTTAILSYSIYEPRVESGEQIADGAIAIGFNIMKALCGSKWLPGEVALPRSKPVDLMPYQRFFQAPVRFDSEQAALLFSTEWLGRKPPRSDAELHEFIAAQLRPKFDDNALAFAAQVRRVMRTQLTNRRVSVDAVAELFGMHRRTLSRRLKTEGTTFDEILNEVRFEIANHFLADTDMPLSQIAAALDYSEASAFTRAFRRWSGASPSDWRQLKRKEHNHVRGGTATDSGQVVSLSRKVNP
ncbi:MAG: AraC family transcriptional regulator [Xanthobacteraceae bacterium]